MVDVYSEGTDDWCLLNKDNVGLRALSLFLL